jgi:hypothetical protein
MTFLTGFIKTWLWGLGDLALKIFLIVMALFLVLEFIKASGVLERSLERVNRFTRHLGLKRQSGMPLLAGFIFGIVFGASLIISSSREQQLDKRQVFLISLFLATCHGIVEDTGLFVVIGANFWWITIPRLLLAVLLTGLISRLYPELVAHETGPEKV